MVITTDRLYLRECVTDDWRTMLRYQSDPRYLRYYPWEQRNTEDVQALVLRFLAWQQEEPRTKYQLAIVLQTDERVSGPLIGTCGLRKPYIEATEAEIGCELDPDYWGQGYAAEALRAMLRFGFGDLHLHRIWASCIAENRAALHLVERLGMRQEGRLREQCWMKGRWWDTVIYALLEHEWIS
jgi:RimJ/RimL family protein N-acetyltransferase